MSTIRQTRFEEAHMHSTYSDGSNTVQELLEYNFLHDQLDLTFSDHVNMETDWFPAYVQELTESRKKYPQFEIFIGCEVKILEDGTLNTTQEILDACDVVIGSVHHFTNIKSMNKEDLLEKEYELTKLITQHSEVDILGHPFSMADRFFGLEPPKEYVQTVYDLCVQSGIKFEFNQKHALGTIRDLVSSEITKGNLDNFSFGSDLHKEASEIGDAAFDLAAPVTVLVTGAGAGIGQSILKALQASKVRTRIICADMNAVAAGMYRSDSAYTIPAASDSGYIKAIEDICKKENVEIICIGTDTELATVAPQKESLENATGAVVIISPSETIEIADDKWKTTEFLRSQEFPYVASALVDDIDKFIVDASFPVVVKPRIGARAIGFEVVEDEQALRSLVAENPDLIIQEYLSSDDEEYTCGAFFLDGECYGVISMKRWLRSGDTHKAVAEHNKELEQFIAKVGSTMKINGPCNFQLRRHNGEWKIFEINCRFSGTTGARSALGFNVVNALLQKIFFDRPLRQLSFKESYVFRYWNEVFAPIETVEKLKAGHIEDPDSFLNQL